MAEHASSLARMKKLGQYKPTIKFGFRLPGHPRDGFTEILPFKKHWPAIAIMTVLTAAFAWPLFTLDLGLGGSEDLFDLTTGLFSLFWGLGWSVAVLILGGILLAMLFAREVLIVEPDRIRLRIEIFRLGLESSTILPYISHLRYVEDGFRAGTSWRGKHLAFDYLQVPISFGSNIDRERARELVGKITAVLSRPVPLRLPEEIQEKMARNDPLPLAEPRAESRESTIPAPAPAQAGGSPLSLWFLLAANLVPLGGVIALGWNVGDIMLLFWLESAIIGFFNILKMFRISGPMAVFYAIFFSGHFGAFMSVHLMFIFALFIEDEGASASLAEVAVIFKDLWMAILALFVSHGFSYATNFLGKREYLELSIKDQMHKPYSRIMLMHVTLIFGGFLILALDSRLLALTLLIALKIIVDMGAHIKEHRDAENKS